MIKKPTAKRSANPARRLLQWGLLHKLKAGLIITGVFVVCLIANTAYTSYMSKFSKDDFDKLTTMAETVLHNTGSGKVYTDRTCSYNHGEFITIPTLTCRVNMVMYLPYVSDANAVATSRTYEQNIRINFGTPVIALSNIYQHPYDGTDTAVINASQMPVRTDCNFTVDDNNRALDAVAFLPEQKDDNLIALSFECSAPARSAYFPVAD